uniref:Uncharacterized protein n=1 Tax=Ditylenchus dipsaci TaxID=166011 RepID=A0A915CQG4_9BILA
MNHPSGSPTYVSSSGGGVSKGGKKPTNISLPDFLRERQVFNSRCDDCNTFKVAGLDLVETEGGHSAYNVAKLLDESLKKAGLNNSSLRFSVEKLELDDDEEVEGVDSEFNYEEPPGEGQDEEDFFDSLPHHTVCLAHILQLVLRDPIYVAASFLDPSVACMDVLLGLGIRAKKAICLWFKALRYQKVKRKYVKSLLLSIKSSISSVKIHAQRSNVLLRCQICKWKLRSILTSFGSLKLQWMQLRFGRKKRLSM